MSNTYNLINPLIKGQFETRYKTENSSKAANFFYKNMSEFFGNRVPAYYFTIQKGGAGKLYHYKVTENKQSNTDSHAEVDYELSQYEIAGGGDIESFTQKLNEIKQNLQKGGKSKKSKRRGHDDDEEPSSSSSSSESEVYSKHYVPAWNTPIYYMYYDPYVYKVDSIWIPTFYNVSPYFEIRSLIY